MKKIFSIQSIDTDLAALLLRLILGGLLCFHGYIKAANYSQILPMFGDPIGLGSALSFNLVIFAELGCGILVAIGLFTRLSVIPILITMIIVFFVAHAKDAFMMKELPFTFLLLTFVVFVLGSGKYSVDSIIGK